MNKHIQFLSFSLLVTRPSEVVTFRRKIPDTVRKVIGFQVLSDAVERIVLNPPSRFENLLNSKRLGVIVAGLKDNTNSDIVCDVVSTMSYGIASGSTRGYIYETDYRKELYAGQLTFGTRDPMYANILFKKSEFYPLDLELKGKHEIEGNYTDEYESFENDRFNPFQFPTTSIPANTVEYEGSFPAKYNVPYRVFVNLMCESVYDEGGKIV